MGQYFEWVNYDRREIIDTDVWDCGVKLHESAFVGCEMTDAALTMLAGDWAGDLVVFLGDYASFENETNPARRRIELLLNGGFSDDYTYDFTDVTGRFDYVETLEDKSHWVYGNGVEEHYEDYTGPYDVHLERFRYVANETRREFLDRSRTAVRYIRPNTGDIVRYDPFPQLMCSEVYDPDLDEVDGAWFGDFVRPSHEAPGDGYAEVHRDYSYWAPPSITCPDEEIHRVIEENGFDVSDEDILDRIARLL